MALSSSATLSYLTFLAVYDVVLACVLLLFLVFPQMNDFGWRTRVKQQLICTT